MPAPKILVIRGGAIGDFILTLPVLTALRETFPATSLELLGYKHIACLAEAANLVESVQALDAPGLATFFASGGKLNPVWCEYFARFGLIISYLYDPDQIFAENLKRCTRAQLITGPHRPDETSHLHAAEVFLKPLEQLAIFDFEFTPEITLPRDGMEGLDSRWLAVHPGSGSEKKNWPLRHWQELLGLLIQETHFQLLLVGGEAEVGTLEKLASSLPARRLKLAHGLPLWTLGSLLQTCGGFIGHDSGITHLAAAVGLPGLVLWGESVEHIWRPPSQAFTVLRNPAGLSDLQVSAVLQAIRSKFSRPVITDSCGL